MRLSADLIAFSALLAAGHAQADSLVGKVVSVVDAYVRVGLDVITS